jgi:hypothetical protein
LIGEVSKRRNSKVLCELTTASCPRIDFFIDLDQVSTFSQVFDGVAG